MLYHPRAAPATQAHMAYGGHRTVIQQSTLYHAEDTESQGITRWPSKAQVLGGLLQPHWETSM